MYRYIHEINDKNNSYSCNIPQKRIGCLVCYLSRLQNYYPLVTWYPSDRQLSRNLRGLFMGLRLQISYESK